MSADGEILVRNALLDGERVDLRAEAGLIAEIGPAIEPRPGENTLDADGSLNQVQ